MPPEAMHVALGIRVTLRTITRYTNKDVPQVPSIRPPPSCPPSSSFISWRRQPLGFASLLGIRHLHKPQSPFPRLFSAPATQPSISRSSHDPARGLVPGRMPCPVTLQQHQPTTHRDQCPHPPVHPPTNSPSLSGPCMPAYPESSPSFHASPTLFDARPAIRRPSRTPAVHA